MAVSVTVYPEDIVPSRPVRLQHYRGDTIKRTVLLMDENTRSTLSRQGMSSFQLKLFSTLAPSADEAPVLLITMTEEAEAGSGRLGYRIPAGASGWDLLTGSTYGVRISASVGSDVRTLVTGKMEIV